MRRIALWGLAAVLAAGAAALALSAPRPLPAEAVAGLTGDAARGERVFWAAGCASCHAAPEAEGPARLVLAGGRRLASDFGTFAVPNISPDPVHGIGDWSLADFASAMLRGVSPGGAHYYPAFPYTSYSRMTLQDVADLKAFLDTLPATDAASQPHEVGFPFNQRRALGLWKRLNLTSDWAMAEAPTPELARGRYLVEALGHCGECHTPRGPLGGLIRSAWLTGAPNPSGRGTIPNLTPAALGWDAGEIAYYLETGFTPEYDSAGGEMAEVVANLSHLPDSDRAAIAAYLLALPGG